MQVNSDLNNQIAVVTGGAGFIGSHLVELLIKRNFTVKVVDDFSVGSEKNLLQIKSNKLHVFKENILNIDPTSEIFKGASYVFHLAGIGDIVPSIERPTAYFETNVLGTIRMLECSRAANVGKFVYAASSSCYGFADTPTDESHPIQPQYPYALSKYQGEQAVFHWGKIYGLPVNSIRIFNAYGTRSKTSGAYGAVFGVFLKQKLANKPLTVVGDGSQARDFVYASDVAHAFLLAATTNVQGESFNLGSGAPQSINKLVSLLESEVIHIPERPGEPKVTYANIEKIKNVLGWKPLVDFESGVKSMLAEIEYWKNAPLWDSESISQATKTWFKYLG